MAAEAAGGGVGGGSNSAKKRGRRHLEDESEDNRVMGEGRHHQRDLTQHATLLGAAGGAQLSTLLARKRGQRLAIYYVVNLKYRYKYSECAHV